jgi:hypothetical protein
LTQAELRQRIRQFADEVSRVLNRTITTAIRLSAVVEERRDDYLGWIGWNISPRAFEPTAPFHVGTGYLDVRYRIDLDPDGYPRILKSRFALYAEQNYESDPLFRYEYQRGDKPYPQAHFHVHGQSEVLDRLGISQTETPLRKIHFPVGGKRYRPILEDLLEMLILHGWATGRAGWEAAIEEGRERYYKTQLGAAVRADPDAAIRVLRDMGKY